MPEAHRANPALTRYADMESFVNGHLGYDRHFGVPADQLMRMPKADDAKGMGELYARLGRPEAPDKYQFNGLEKLGPEDQAFVNGFRQVAFDSGASQKTVDALFGQLTAALAQTDETYAKQTQTNRDNATAALKQAWGDNYDVMRSDIPASLEWLGQKAGLIDKVDPTKPETAAKAAQQKDDLLKALNVGAEADNPALLRLLGALSDLRAEGGSLPGQGRATATDGMTREQAAAEKDKLYADPEWTRAINDSSHARHKEAIAQRETLNRIIAQPQQTA